ncbi:MAG: hypothetical protein ACREOE_00160 [Gemmatimonadales bacterium]
MVTRLALALALLTASRAQAQTPISGDTAMDAAAMGSMDHPMAEPHMRMTDPWPASAADSTRGAALVTFIRQHLARFQSVDTALADGFRPFHPEVPQPVYHYTNLMHGLEARFAFDPAHPTSLLYRKNADGTFTLVGVMYTAPRSFPDSALDARVPLSLTHWHEHINWCVPPKGQDRRWTERHDGTSVFGPHSAIATREACDSVDGRFLPLVFNWMVHVNAFASDDPRIIWGAEPPAR